MLPTYNLAFNYTTVSVFLTENDQHVNVIYDQKEITKLILVIDEYYLGQKLYIYIYISKYFSKYFFRNIK